MASALLLAGSALIAGAAAQTSNPIKVSSSNFLGYRNSSNTQSLRDLGFAGHVGDTWILSFGDAVGTTNINDFNVNANSSAGQSNNACFDITGRDGGGLMGDDPLSYTDIATTTVGNCGDVLQMAYWCPLLPGDEDYEGLGITGVVEVNSTNGVIWTRPTVSSSSLNTTGAGLALVTLTDNGAECTRPFGKSTWGADEPTWGQLGGIQGQTDGYTYVYANGYNNSAEINTVVLARAPSDQVFDLAAYEYYQGNGVFTSDRIYIDQLTDSSPQNTGLLAGQGSVFWSTYYNAYVYISNGYTFFDLDNVYASVAPNPWGPWSDSVVIYQDTYPYPQRTAYSFLEYGAAALPNYFSDDGKTIYFGYTRAAYYEGVAEVVFE